MERWLERSARRLAAPQAASGVDRLAARLANGTSTRRQALAAGGVLAALTALPRSAGAQLLPDCPPPGFSAETKKCPYQCPGFNPNWICCRPNSDCCVNQPQVNGIGACAVGCCEEGQNCCYSPSLGAWGCCGCPLGFHHCGLEPLGGQCCRQDQVCDVVNFVCRDGDECPAPNVLCGSVCCQPGESCAGGSCCQAAKAGGCATCCGRGEICDGTTCKPLVDFKQPPRQRAKDQGRYDKMDAPPLQTFDADVAAEMNYAAHSGGGANAAALPNGFVIARAKVTLKARRRRRVSMRLTRRAQREIRRGRSIRAVFTLKIRDAQGRTITETSPVTILPPKRRRRRR